MIYLQFVLFEYSRGVQSVSRNVTVKNERIYLSKMPIKMTLNTEHLASEILYPVIYKKKKKIKGKETVVRI